MENIIENNRLIAEFLGFQLTDLGWFDSEEVLSNIERDNTFDNLKFHYDWNWLIKIVEKIEGVEDENRCAKYNIKIEQCFVEIIENHTSETIIEVDCNSKIQAVYNACVKFINWYNKQNKNNESL